VSMRWGTEIMQVMPATRACGFDSLGIPMIMQRLLRRQVRGACGTGPGAWQVGESSPRSGGMLPAPSEASACDS
jgi:hypothetical protein